MSVNQNLGLIEPGCIAIELFELELQALLQVPGEYAHGLKLLQGMQNCGDFFALYIYFYSASPSLKCIR